MLIGLILCFLGVNFVFKPKEKLHLKTNTYDLCLFQKSLSNVG